MVTHTLYINGDGVCRIINHLNGVLQCDKLETKIKKDRKHIHEIQVPITWIGNIYYKQNNIIIYPKDFEKKGSY
jgi:hypothetical protein